MRAPRIAAQQTVPTTVGEDGLERELRLLRLLKACDGDRGHALRVERLIELGKRLDAGLR